MMILNVEIRFEEKHLPLFTASQKKRQVLLGPQDKEIDSLIKFLKKCLEALDSYALLMSRLYFGIIINQ